ncbi:MAG: hypothetical protein AAF585_23980 [Verrucomicrobiota bacterium]
MIVAVLGFAAGVIGGWLRWRNERSRIQQLIDENTTMCREIEQLESRGPAALRPAGEAESPSQVRQTPIRETIPLGAS